MPRQKSTHVDSPISVGRRLKEAREAAGLSQRQLSFSGCSPAYISRIESGDRIPSLQLLRELGRRLGGVSEDYLATGQATVPKDEDEFVEAELALLLGDLETSERMYTERLERAVTGSDTARSLAGLGQLALRRGEPRQAIELLEESLTAAPAECEPDVADSLGRAYAMVGELESAIAVFERCLQAAQERDNAIEEVRFTILLAYALIDTGNFGRAEELLGRALADRERVNDPILRARLYGSQSKLHIERNEPDTAARYARRALEILKLTEDSHRIGVAHQLLAHVELDRGRADEALELLTEGWPLLEQTGNPVERAHFRIEEARALARLGRSEEAAALAMQMSGLLGDAQPEDAARAYSLLGEIFVELGHTERAQEVWELAAEILERKSPNRYLVEVYSKLAELHEAAGRKEEAFELMKKALGAQRALAEKIHP